MEKLTGRQVVAYINALIDQKENTKLRELLEKNPNYSVTYINALSLDIEMNLLKIKMVNLEVSNLLVKL